MFTFSFTSGHNPTDRKTKAISFIVCFPVLLPHVTDQPRHLSSHGAAKTSTLETTTSSTPRRRPRTFWRPQLRSNTSPLIPKQQQLHFFNHDDWRSFLEQQAVPTRHPDSPARAARPRRLPRLVTSLQPPVVDAAAARTATSCCCIIFDS